MAPTYITSSLASSFAGKTLRKRLPAILKSVIKKNKFKKVIKQELKQLLTELPYAPIKRFTYQSIEEEKYWEVLFEEYRDTPWIDLPFYLAEALFYRQILEKTDWYNTKIDPFAIHKADTLKAQYENIHNLLINTQKLLNTSFNESDFIYLLKQNLWGNQADLSLFHDGNLPESSFNENDYLLHDDSLKCAQFIKKKPTQIDFLIDNIGIELIGDMALALYLIHHEKVETVNFHIKATPIFVSDVIEEDISKHLQLLEKSDHEISSMATIFSEYVEKGTINILPNLYWNSPLFYNWMPLHLSSIFTKSDLIISKGDAHYRRFLQDRSWEYHEPLSNVIHFFNKPLWLLRTLKSEVLAGVSKKQITNANQLDQNWLTNGKFGIIQFHNFQ